MIPPAQDGVGRISVALDGSERGLGVLAFALNLAQAARSRLRVVTVERPREDESAELARSLPEGRSERLAQAIDRLRLEEAIAESLWEPASEATGGRPLTVLRGDPVEQIVEDLRRSSTDILAVGYPLGGPPGVVEGESVARRLVHLAPCSVLTVPL
jgi:nucleotide-binding universal stress UspA family protein